MNALPIFVEILKIEKSTMFQVGIKVPKNFCEKIRKQPFKKFYQKLERQNKIPKEIAEKTHETKQQQKVYTLG